MISNRNVQWVTVGQISDQAALDMGVKNVKDGDHEAYCSHPCRPAASRVSVLGYVAIQRKCRRGALGIDDIGRRWISGDASSRLAGASAFKVSQMDEYLWIWSGRAFDRNRIVCNFVFFGHRS